ncbi:NACHT domain-containing NTPase [Reyranella sp. CPCC 100927]|uniref:NACHT domain-containing protein n=1 Tax=Reyranella sp. CPCC 100927 TaxID=2599616 RepID=UPI0015B6802F|nr:NACHT domain-containing protein [Reyranella sp. CPCC 100927]
MGQAQQGIDLFVRMVSGKYEVWQAKRYASIASSDVKKIVDEFRTGNWKDKSDRLILAVQASLADTKVQNEIEARAAALKEEGITFVAYGGEELSGLLRNHPDIVDDFFGRNWVEAFLGLEATRALGARLDGGEFARVREQLRRFYDAHFHLLDVGVALPFGGTDPTQDAPPTLLARFAPPDVLVRDTSEGGWTPPQQANSQMLKNVNGALDSSDEKRPAAIRKRDYVRRASLASWLADGMHLAIVGEAGSGKSTLLRCLVLDLLTEQNIFPQSARRWGGLLPIHISFSRWSRLSARQQRAAGLKEVVAETLQPALTVDLILLLNRAIDERRVLLLIDGLDEWSEEQAARTTLQHVLAFVATHNLPTIATARPRGLDKIATIPPGWQVAELASLSLAQQRTLAGVWFTRGLDKVMVASERGSEIQGPIEARLDRFFAELGRDRRLSSLAGNPLLLVALIALSIRQIALPRNKMQAIQSLVSILVETHPEHRATAAGDIKARFTHIPDAEDRRVVLGRLAFVVRSASGGGTFDIKEARRIIRDYLADSNTLVFSGERAQQAAAEMLAVNAETMGLLAERAPGEIGFAHAVFEEYLAAEHIHRLAFGEITAFVRDHSGSPLWRNVISNLIALLARPTEVESVVAAIEAAHAADVSREGAVNREVLLADIAFNSSRKQPATTQRLIDRAFNIIERGDWLLARREVLKAALTTLGDGVSPASVEDCLAAWAPRRDKYSSGLFEALGRWKPAPDLLKVLLGALHDEERGKQRSAVRVLARLYGGEPNVQQHLRDALRSTADTSVAAAMLEALTLGWPKTTDLSALHDAAVSSRDPTIRFVGISGRIAGARGDQSDRDGIVDLLSEFPEIDYSDRGEARRQLSQHWPDDPALIDVSLRSTRRGGFSHREFERGSAMHYLIRCSPKNSRVLDWVKEELLREHPFSLAYGDIWNRVTPFANEHSEIRAAVISYVKSKLGRHQLHDCQDLIIKLGGDELRDALIGICNDEKRWSDVWAVRALLQGWGHSDPVASSFLDEIVSWDDKRLENLAPLLPQIIHDFDACRARLLSLARESEQPRFNSIARGFAALGCKSDDTEVVDTLLAAVGKGSPAYDPSETILTHFSGNSSVRRYALQALSDRDPPLAALARVYEDDTDIRSQILACANPLPIALRGEIVEAAFAEADNRPAFKRVLENYDIEVDGNLKIATSIYFHRYMHRVPSFAASDHLKKVEEDLHAVGLEMDERRAAAFAGMLILGHVNDIPPMVEYGDEPLRIRTGAGYGKESDSLMALMAERWEEVREAFRDSLPARFGAFGADEAHLWDCLAPHINASLAARQDFLAFCNRTDATLGMKSIAALAREQPSSELLLNHCCRVFEREVTGPHERHSPWAVKRTRLEIAYVLRDQFHYRADLRERLRKTLKPWHGEGVIWFLLTEPNDPWFAGIRRTPMEIALESSDWVSATHLASARSGSQEFVEVALAMINRQVFNIWNFQSVINRAVIERLGRDTQVAHRFKETLDCCPTESEIASLPRYLMAAGASDSSLHERCRALLEDEARYPLPRAGYDVIEDSVRSVSHSLLEVLAPSFVQ